MFQLLNPLLLLGLTAMAIPIAIHIISRHRAKVVPFGSIVFLEESVRERGGIKRFQELLTLLLRCLLILFLVLAASKPLLKRSKGSILGAGSETDVIIILDNSCSMGYRDGENTHFDRAKAVGEQILNSLEMNDRALIFTPNGTENRSSSWDEATIDDARKRLSAAQLSLGSTSYLFSLDAAMEMMNSAKGAIREIHIVSDFQKLSLFEPELMEKFRGAKTEASVYAIPVTRTRGQNSALQEVSLLEPYPLAGRPITIRTSLRNYGDKPSVETAVLTIDGERIAKRELRLEPGESESLSFHHIFEEPGRHSVEVSFQDADPLPADNRRFLPIIVNEAMPVLLVDGGDLRLGPRSETFYLKIALAPGLSASGSPLKPKTVSADALAREKLDAYPVIMLANVPDLDADVLKSLEKAVEKGASLAIFLGERVMPNGGLYSKSKLFPLRLGARRMADDGTGFQINVTQFSHPLFRRFRRGEAGNISQVKFQQYWQLLSDEKEKFLIPAYFQKDDPAVIETNNGRGRIVIFTSKCDADWSDFPRRSTYLPFIQQLVDHLSPTHETGRKFLVDQPVPFVFDFRNTRVPVAIRMSNNSTIRLVASGQEQARATFYDSHRPGFYFADIFRPDGIIEDMFVVNTDQGESDLTPAEQSELDDLVPNRTTFVPMTADLSELLKRQRVGVELWGNMLFLVLALAVVESYMANRSTPA